MTSPFRPKPFIPLFCLLFASCSSTEAPDLTEPIKPIEESVPKEQPLEEPLRERLEAVLQVLTEKDKINAELSDQLEHTTHELKIAKEALAQAEERRLETGEAITAEEHELRDLASEIERRALAQLEEDFKLIEVPFRYLDAWKQPFADFSALEESQELIESACLDRRKIIVLGYGCWEGEDVSKTKEIAAGRASTVASRIAEYPSCSYYRDISHQGLGIYPKLDLLIEGAETPEEEEEWIRWSRHALVLVPLPDKEPIGEE